MQNINSRLERIFCILITARPLGRSVFASSSWSKNDYCTNNGQFTEVISQLISVAHYFDQMNVLHCKDFSSNILNLKLPSAPLPVLHHVYFTEMMKKSTSREKIFREGKCKELDNLINIGTWKIVCIDNVSKHANILARRFVLAIEKTNTFLLVFLSLLCQGRKNKRRSLESWTYCLGLSK